MSVGAYLANKSEHDMYKKHLSEEQQNLRNAPLQATETIRALYAKK